MRGRSGTDADARFRQQQHITLTAGGSLSRSRSAQSLKLLADQSNDDKLAVSVYNLLYYVTIIFFSAAWSIVLKNALQSNDDKQAVRVHNLLCCVIIFWFIPGWPVQYCISLWFLMLYMFVFISGSILTNCNSMTWD